MDQARPTDLPEGLHFEDEPEEEFFEEVWDYADDLKEEKIRKKKSKRDGGFKGWRGMPKNKRPRESNL